jgi:hypothetical protein
MMKDNPSVQELRDILLRLSDNSIAQEDFKRLEQMVQQDKKLRDYYVDFMVVHAALRSRAGILPTLVTCENTDIRSALLWQQLAEYERNSAPFEIAAKEEDPVVISGIRELKQQLRSTQTVSRMSLYTFIGGIAALFILIAYVLYNPRFIPEPVASLKDTYLAKWETVPEGGRLTNARMPLKLTAGHAKVRFDSGAEVCIEGPAEFYLLSSEQIRLNLGKMTAHVPPKAAGFRVDTPAMSVIDLGTEFAVKVCHDGIGEVHLFDGKASLLSGELGTRQGSQILTRGQARSVGITGNVREIAISKDGFVRRFYSDQKLLWRGEAINLASLIAGGNGFDPVLEFRSLNPNTGHYETVPLISREIKAVYGYHRVEKNQFVDGVFVPNADQSPTIVSSQGHVFNGPSTSEIFTFNIISFFQQYDTSVCNAQPPVFDDIQYNTQTQPTVLLHSNIGITIDLESVRQAYPGLKISKMITGYGSTWAEKRSQVDFFVLVDGAVKHEHKQIRSRKASWPLELDIGSGDRFLTFIVTDSPEVNQAADLAHKFDFFYLLSPRLMMD